jgi:hypothetical protein
MRNLVPVDKEAGEYFLLSDSVRSRFVDIPNVDMLIAGAVRFQQIGWLISWRCWLAALVGAD